MSLFFWRLMLLKIALSCRLFPSKPLSRISIRCWSARVPSLLTWLFIRAMVHSAKIRRLFSEHWITGSRIPKDVEWRVRSFIERCWLYH
jgi:hypothetical protein